MKALGRTLSGLFLLLVFIASIVFSYSNSEPTALYIGDMALPALPLSAWVIGAFVLGGVMGLLLGLRIFKHLALRLELGRVRKQLSKAEAELRGKNGTRGG